MEKIKEIKILSLFNGMGKMRQALENVGYKVTRSYSSEIKKYAIELVQFHIPDTIPVGDINNWREWDIDWSKIDMIGSGSPCQDLSIAGKRKGLEGERSGLFWVFIEILNHCKKFNPNVLFFQENVGSAPRKDVGIMSRAMGVYPVRFNSELVVAQLRDRYYWTNIRTRKDGLFGDIVVDIPPPKDRKIMFKDIITDGNVERIKALSLLESQGRNDTTEKNIIKRGEKGFLNNIFVKRDKANCMLEGNQNLYTYDGYRVRTVNKIEMCRLQGFPDDYCDILSKAKAGSVLGDGWTLPIIEHFFNYIEL